MLYSTWHLWCESGTSYIVHTKYIYIVFLSSFSVIHAEKCRLGSIPASQASQKLIDSKTEKGEIYHHWFSLALYDLHHFLKSKNVDTTAESNIEFNFEGTNHSIPVTSLESVLACWRHCDNEYACQHELVHSSIICAELDTFLFGECTNGHCYHQLPFTKKYECTDFLISSLNECRCPAEFVGSADYKKTEFSAALKESCAYAIRVDEEREKFYLQIFFPCSSYKVEFYVGISIDNKLRTILIHQYIPPSRTFLCLLYAAVQYLFKHPIFYDKPCVVPKKELELDEALSLTECPRVFKKQEYVYKLYKVSKTDNYVEVPNLEIVALVHPDAIVIDLSSNKVYQMLKYKYQKGGGLKTITARQISKLLLQLHSIHARQFVHSDIRAVNLVVSTDGENASLIDFDLADKVGTLYPKSFNRDNIPERHKSAKKMKERLKIHDVHALSVIMKMHSRILIDIREQYEDENKTLLEISDMLLNT